MKRRRSQPFKFKFFTIVQYENAMKVCTDSCLFGAWVDVQCDTSILDIGTGTGLLALMMAQRSTCPIDAVEVQKVAAMEAERNIVNSNWSSRIKVYQDDITLLSQQLRHHTYSHIVCNPPFFENHLRSSSKSLNFARHDVALGLPGLLQVIQNMLDENGKASILLPYDPYKDIIDIIQSYSFEVSRLCDVRNYSGEKPIRRMIEIKKHYPGPPERSELVIYETPGQYTDSFITLLKPYYLHL